MLALGTAGAWEEAGRSQKAKLVLLTSSALLLLVFLPALQRALSCPREPAESFAVDSVRSRVSESPVSNCLSEARGFVVLPAALTEGTDSQLQLGPPRDGSVLAGLLCRRGWWCFRPLPPFRLWLHFFLQLSGLRGQEYFVPAFRPGLILRTSTVVLLDLRACAGLVPYCSCFGLSTWCSEQPGDETACAELLPSFDPS